MNRRSGVEKRAEFKKIKDCFFKELARLDSEIIEILRETPDMVNIDYSNFLNLHYTNKEIHMIKILVNNWDRELIKHQQAKDYLKSILTERQQTIFKLSAEGLKSMDIAQELNTTKNNVNKQLQNILKKISMDKLLLDLIKNCDCKNQFTNPNYITDKPDKKGNYLDRIELRHPQKLIKFLYDILLD